MPLLKLVKSKVNFAKQTEDVEDALGMALLGIVPDTDKI